MEANVVPIFRIHRRSSHRVVVLAVLGAFVAGLFPMPMLSPQAPSQDGSLYPCKGGTCGCNTAEKCWKSCCCHTPEERLAWAVKHGVTPPAYAILESRREPRTLASVEMKAVRKCCTESHPSIKTNRAPSGNLLTVNTADEPHCGVSSGKLTKTAFRQPTTTEPMRQVSCKSNKRGWVDALSAARCNGHRYDLTGGMAFVEPSIINLPDPSPLLERVTIPSGPWHSAPLFFDPPPPRGFLPTCA